MSNAKVRARRRTRARTAIPYPTPWKDRPRDPAHAARAAKAQRLCAELNTIPVDPSPMRRNRQGTARALMMLAALAGMGFGS